MQKIVHETVLTPPAAYKIRDLDLPAIQPEVSLTFKIGQAVKGEPFNFQSQDLLDALCGYLRHSEPIQPDSSPKKINIDQLSELITDALSPGKRYRPKGWKVSSTNRASILETVKGHVEHGIPIHATMMSGAGKSFCKLAGKDYPDLADLLSIQRLIGVDRDVRKIYPPGMKIFMITEDFGEEYLNTNCNSIRHSIQNYRNGLSTLCRLLSPGVVYLVPESELFRNISIEDKTADYFGIPKGENVDRYNFRIIADSFSEYFLDYFTEVKQKGFSCISDVDEFNHKATSLQSFQTLSKLGWRGGIPPRQLEHYLQRALNELGPDGSEEQALGQVAAYLGAAFTRIHLSLLKKQFFYDENIGNIQPLKFSYIPYPPGTPAGVETNRLEYKVTHNSANSGNHVAPWCGTGNFAASDSGLQPSVSGFRQYDKVTRRQAASITISGSTNKGDEQIILESDIVCKLA